MLFKFREAMAEAAGTFILVLFGCGSIAVSIWLGGPYGLWPIALMFALGVMLGVYVAGHISGGHINPAVTISMAIFTDFEWKKVPHYILGQMVGAFLASFVIWLSFNNVAVAFEAAQGIVRGGAGSELSMMGYATFAPNPAFAGGNPAAFAKIGNVQWFISEAIFTALLLFGVFFLTDKNNKIAPQSNLAPVFIGLLVAGIIAFEAPISMTALNPARDLGPRIFAAAAGWGRIAFPGPNGGWWITSVSTIVGGIIGSAVYTWLFKPAMASKE